MGLADGLSWGRLFTASTVATGGVLAVVVVVGVLIRWGLREQFEGARRSSFLEGLLMPIRSQCTFGPRGVVLGCYRCRSGLDLRALISVVLDAMELKLFPQKQARAAIEHARAGGRSLHIWFLSKTWFPAGPFYDGHDEWGHLIDFDQDRLKEASKHLGPRSPEVYVLDGTPVVYLCGEALEQAKTECP